MTVNVNLKYIESRVIIRLKDVPNLKEIKRRAYFVKHFINDLAGLLSTPRLRASSINIGPKISLCLIGQLNRL